MTRKSIPGSVESAILRECARRCALCYGLNDDLGQKQGQIAHVNHDASDGRSENLVFLCLPHHDEYDTVRRQTKSITQAEVLAYKEGLAAAVASGEHRLVSATPGVSSKVREHDTKLFLEADGMLPEAALREWCDRLVGDNSYDVVGVRGVDKFLRHSALTGNRFMAPSLQAVHQQFAIALGELRGFLSTHFFVYPLIQRERNLRLCLYPEQNIDRGGDGSRKSRDHYEKHRVALEALVEKVEAAYDVYRNLVKTELAE